MFVAPWSILSGNFDTVIEQSQIFTLSIPIPTAIYNREVGGGGRDTSVGEDNVARKCSSFYDQSFLLTLKPLSNAPNFYVLKANPNIYLRQEIRNRSVYFGTKGENWRLNVRLSTANPFLVTSIPLSNASSFLHYQYLFGQSAITGKQER